MEHSADEQLRMISGCNFPASSGDALSLFFNCWMEHALDTAGEFPLRLCGWAIARLLCSKHPALEKIQVRLRWRVDLVHECFMLKLLFTRPLQPIGYTVLRCTVWHVVSILL